MRIPDSVRSIAILLVYPAAIALNFIPFHGESAASVMRRTPVLPLNAAGFTFAIWGLLFAWQIAYAVFQALPAQRSRPTLRLAANHLLVNGVAQGLWPLAVIYGSQTIGWMLIVMMLSSLLTVELRLSKIELDTKERWLMQIPFQANLGWISAAMILSTAALLHDTVGWDGSPLSPQVWGVAMVLIAAGLGVAMSLLRKAYAYGIVTVWALIGIAVGSAPMVARVAAVAAGLVMLSVVWSMSRPRSWVSPMPVTNNG